MVMTHDDASRSTRGRHERDPRSCLRLQLSQSQFATLLGVSVETYRTWDSARRVVPDEWLDKARAGAATNDPNRLWSLRDSQLKSAFTCEMCPRA